MSYCLNPECKNPKNLAAAEFCRACGAKLLLKDRYRTIALIGQGGFGRTFLAIDEDKPSKPRCVVKQFLPSGKGTQHLQKAANLFEQEAMRLEELGTHPQIPALLAHLSQQQHQYLVQEFIDGKNLVEVLAERGALSESQVRSVLLSLLPVLEFIHSHGVIHRDIKPANIIATPGSSIMSGSRPSGQFDWSELLQVLAKETAQGFRDFISQHYRFSQLLSQRLSTVPKEVAIADYHRCQHIANQFARYPALTVSQRQYLVADASRLLYELRQKYERQGNTVEDSLVLVDFGAAKLSKGTSTSRTGTAIGSPGYLAPEQAQGKAEFASDLYSLGVTCIHLLTNTSPLDLFDSHENAWNWRPYLKDTISDHGGQLLDRLIELGTSRRYRSAAEVLRELDPRSLSLDSSRAVPSLAPVAAVPSRPSYPSLVNPVVSASQPPRPASKQRSQGAWQCVHRFVSPGKVYAIALSPTEPLLASSSGTTIRLWDVQAGQPIQTLTGHLDVISSLAISPDGKLLISGSADKTLRFWELSSGKRLGSLTLHTDTVLAVAIAPDGKTLASSSFHDPIILLDMMTGRERDKLYGHTQRVGALAFSPDGMLLASGSSDASIKLWDVGTGRELRSLEGHTETVTSLAFSPDGKTLASASGDGTVKLWSTRVRRQKRTFCLDSGRVNSLCFSVDGKLLITGSDALQLWNVRSGKLVGSIAGPTTSVCTVAVHPDAASGGSGGQRLAGASWDGTIQIWQPEGTAPTLASRRLP